MNIFSWLSDRTDKQCLYTNFHATQDPRDNQKQVLMLYERKKKYEVKVYGFM